jgi:TolB protein
MQTGVKISAGVHGAVLAWVLVGGTIFRPAPPDPAPMAVTLISAPVFDAMRAPAPEAPQDAPRAAPAAQPEPPPTAPATAPAPPARPDPTETAIALPDPAPVPPAAEPAPATSPLAVAPPPPDAAIAPAPADRVAPVARPAPPEAMPRAADERPALAPAPDAPPVTQAPAPAAAPQAAAPQIVTEAEIAPGRSPRPPGRPPAVAAPAPAPEADTAPTPDSGMSMADALAAAASASAPPAPAAQLSEFETRGPLRIEITEGVIEPLPFAVPDFVADNAGAASWRGITAVVASDLTGTGLFRDCRPRPISRGHQLSTRRCVFRLEGDQRAGADHRRRRDAAVRQLVGAFRLFDVFSGRRAGRGAAIRGTQAGWRRMAHKVADAVYSADHRRGRLFRQPRGVRVGKRAEGRAAQAPGDHGLRRRERAVPDRQPALVLAPRFSPAPATGCSTPATNRGFPAGLRARCRPPCSAVLDKRGPAHELRAALLARWQRGGLFAEQGGNTDIYTLDLATGRRTRLTSAPSIETAPSFSPDGSQIVFESDRSGTQQLYIMPANGGEARRISFGQGRYGTPVWSPRGD